MASSFARLARSAELSGRLQVSKEPVENPPYDIHKLGDEGLRQRVAFTPYPLCWTEAPESAASPAAL